MSLECPWVGGPLVSLTVGSILPSLLGRSSTPCADDEAGCRFVGGEVRSIPSGQSGRSSFSIRGLREVLAIGVDVMSGSLWVECT